MGACDSALGPALANPHPAVVANADANTAAFADVGASASPATTPNSPRGLTPPPAKNLVPCAWPGRNGEKMSKYVDILLIVPSDDTARIQEMHITLGHRLCGALEQKLGLA